MTVFGGFRKNERDDFFFPGAAQMTKLVLYFKRDPRSLAKPPAGIRNHLLESLGPGTDSFLSLLAFLAHEGVQGHVQMLASRVLPTACVYA